MYEKLYLYPIRIESLRQGSPIVAVYPNGAYKFNGTGIGFGFGAGCGFGVGWGFGGMPLNFLGLGAGGGCGVGVGLGWGFGAGFGSKYRSSRVIFQGVKFNKKSETEETQAS